MKSFGHIRRQLDANGDLERLLDSPARARTVKGLGPNYGLDCGKRLVVTLRAGDLICLRPEKTQREVSILAVDLYGEIVRRAARSDAARRANVTRKRRAGK